MRDSHRGARTMGDWLVQFTGDSPTVGSVTPGAGRWRVHETRTYRSDPGELADIRGFVRAACVSGWSDGGEKAVEALILAVHEVVANIMRHAYEGHKECEIELSVDVDDERACVCLGDTGIPFDHTAVPPPQFDGSRTGGFGVYLVGELVDEVDYSTDSGKNVCRLVKRRV